MTIAVLEGREDSAIFDFCCWPMLSKKSLCTVGPKF
jgi:hypothetical protein